MVVKKIENIIEDFESITKIKCVYSIMEKGDDHVPTKLSKEQQGVYVFFNEDKAFKVGKAGAKSQARWNSHHYNLDEKTPSTFPKSFMANLENFKSFFPDNMHKEMEAINNSNVKNWVRKNLSRIEFKISSEESKIALNLLEALVQFYFPPLYEGRKR